MSKVQRVITIGEATIDMITQPDGSFAPVAGGSSIIVAIALGRQNVNVAAYTPISTDAFGEYTRARLEESGVDTSLLKSVDVPSTLSIATIDEHGDAKYTFYINGCSQGTWSSSDVPELNDCDIISLCGSFSLGLDSMADAFDAIYERYSDTHILVFDPNVRPATIGDDTQLAKERLERWASKSTIVRASTEDIFELYPETTVHDVAQRFLDLGTKLVTITDSGVGAFAFTQNAAVHSPAVPISKEDLGDTVGAGDTFNAGILKWLIERDQIKPEAIARLQENDLISMLITGITLATETSKKIGAEPPFASSDAIPYKPVQASRPLSV